MTTPRSSIGHIIGFRHPQDLENLFRAHGLVCTSNPFCVRIRDYDHFVIEFDHGINHVHADAESTDRLLHHARRVSEILTQERIQHHLEVYDAQDALAGTFSFEPSP